MALLKCPECDLQVSDKALICPHCGYPMKETSPKKVYKKANRRRRLPNGFGSITEVKGRELRNPFWARLFTGKNPLGGIFISPLVTLKRIMMRMLHLLNIIKTEVIN